MTNEKGKKKDDEELLAGFKQTFAIGYQFFPDGKEWDEQHLTELSMYIEGVNILEFDYRGHETTTCWKLDNLTEWLAHFVHNLHEDPYPVDVPGENAAIKDYNAREFDTDNEEEFDEYYDKLYYWCLNHNWNHESAGGILANVFFELVGENVEISWDNRDSEEGVEFHCLLGMARIPRATFTQVVKEFLTAYADHWFSE